MKVSLLRTASMNSLPVGVGFRLVDGIQVEEVLRILGFISSKFRDWTSRTAVCGTSDWMQWKVCTAGVKFNNGPKLPLESTIGMVVYMRSEVGKTYT